MMCTNLNKHHPRIGILQLLCLIDTFDFSRQQLPGFFGGVAWFGNIQTTNQVALFSIAKQPARFSN